VLTRFRLAVFAAAALAGVWAGQADAFWPFDEPQHVSLAPAYGGVCEGCDLSGRILVGAKLTHSVFNRSDFSNAVLSRADATGSEFERADFTEADLTEVRLIDTLCPRSTFDRALLVRTDARGANFTRASFRGADVTHMNFEHAILSGADLRSVRGLTQAQLDAACGDHRTRLPRGMRVRRCEG
jgi:uncharacterized protein YjbI with pentapeptide repeats